MGNPRVNINLQGGMYFGSDSIVTPNPNFVNFGVTSINASDELGSVSATTTRFGRPTSSLDWPRQGIDIGEVTVERVSEAKSYSDYIFKNEFETMKDFEREIFLWLNQVGEILPWLDQLYPFHHRKTNSPFQHHKMEKSNSTYHHRKIEKGNSPFHHKNGKSNSPFHHRKTEKSISPFQILSQWHDKHNCQRKMEKGTY